MKTLMNMILLTAVMLCFGIEVMATEADETVTLTTSLQMNSCPKLRLKHFSYGFDATGRRLLADMACWDAARKIFVPGTQVHFEIGVPLQNGTSGTSLTGMGFLNATPTGPEFVGFTNGGLRGDCSVSKADLKQYLVAAVNDSKSDPLAAAFRVLSIKCLGGTEG